MVVGAGPAGIAAALAAADAGVDVVLIDSGRAVGGQFNRQLPVEFAARRPGKLQHGWKGFAERRDRVGAHPRITHLAESSVWAIEGLRLWVQRGPADAAGREVFAVDAKSVVLATGAYDRVLPFPGWDLPGVYSAGAAQALAKGQRISVGQRVIVADRPVPSPGRARSSSDRDGGAYSARPRISSASRCTSIRIVRRRGQVAAAGDQHHERARGHAARREPSVGGKLDIEPLAAHRGRSR